METIYGEHLPEMQKTMREILSRIDALRQDLTETFGMDPIEHCLSRIKAEESMREKCRRNGLPETTESALRAIKDAIGIRIVCAFLSDVYRVAEFLKSFADLSVVTEKDYIRNVKPNGYRSYHMILKTERARQNSVRLFSLPIFSVWTAL